MSQFYQDLDRAGGLDYRLYQLPQFRNRYFRGPLADTSGPYLAVVGAAQAFGRFVDEPFAAILGRSLGIPVLNLAVGGAGPRHFDHPAYLDLINGAEAVVVQVLSGRSASNSLFDNSEWGGVRGRLRTDQSSVRADEVFAQLAGAGEAEIKKVIAETRCDYLASFISLLSKITVPRILFWLSTRAPDYEDDYSDLPRSIFRAMPQLVNRRMVEELSVFADAYVECVSRTDLPQKLWPSDSSINGAELRDGVLENSYYPSPAMHVEAAVALEPTCRKFLGKPVVEQPGVTTTRFVVVAAERTGTNLLMSLLNDFDGFFAAFELFNPVNIANDVLPWRGLESEEIPSLLRLRSQDPVGFWKAFCARSEARGHRASGFKLFYGHALARPALLEHLAADTSIRIIHVTRRNLLRRTVSEEQARASGEWAQRMSAKESHTEPVAIPLRDLVNSFAMIEDEQQKFDGIFCGHPVLRIVYEDLSQRPERTARRAAEFLGLQAGVTKPAIKYRKTGADEISDALSNVDVLRARLARWLSFFDE